MPRRAARRRAGDAAARRARAGRGLGRDRGRPRPHRRARRPRTGSTRAGTRTSRPTAAARASSASWSRPASACRGCCGRPGRSAPSSRRTSWTGWSTCSPCPPPSAPAAPAAASSSTRRPTPCCARSWRRASRRAPTGGALVAYCSTQTHSSVEKDLRVAGHPAPALDRRRRRLRDAAGRARPADRRRPRGGPAAVLLLRHARHDVVAGVRPGARDRRDLPRRRRSGCTSTPRWPAWPPSAPSTGGSTTASSWRRATPRTRTSGCSRTSTATCSGCRPRGADRGAVDPAGVPAQRGDRERRGHRLPRLARAARAAGSAR